MISPFTFFTFVLAPSDPGHNILVSLKATSTRVNIHRDKQSQELAKDSDTTLEKWRKSPNLSDNSHGYLLIKVKKLR